MTTEPDRSAPPMRHFDVEIVDAVETPPKNMPPGAHTKQDSEAYLKDFLAHSDPAAPLQGDALTEALTDALRDIYDPEIPVNIYDLGLIYDVHAEDGHVSITMTLTTPNCPVAESMPGEVELRILAVPGVATCDVDLVWEPAWNPDNMTDEAKLELGLL